VEHLSHTVSEGKDFSYALSCHPRTFSRMFIAMMQAAEKSGMLAKMLNRATGYLRDEQDTVRKVRGALTYPGIMLAFAVTTTIFLLVFVLPRFTSIYASKKAALPIPTKVLMDLSDFVCRNWIALVAGTVVTLVGGFFYFRTSVGALTWHYIQLRIPLLGKMYRKMHLSRGLRMIGTLCGAGVPLIDCVATARDLCANRYFQALWTKVSDEIQAGKQLSQPMFESSLVPRSVAQMLSCGEKGGKLGAVMEQVAGYAESELKAQIADMTRYSEPAMIVLMGFIIGGVAMALLLPIFTISKVMAS
jgi:type IV pilus assembly protein PilC